MTDSVAPGELEDVRAFLNTLRRPHDTREVTDDLVAWEPAEWQTRMPHLPAPGVEDMAAVRSLRDALRGQLGVAVPEVLNSWFHDHPVVASVGDHTAPLMLRPTRPDTVGVLLTLVADALRQHQWSRLKACPDCIHVFYDHSRNRSRTWCSMYAGDDDGRACGSIAKVRSYRDRRKQPPESR